MSNYTEQDIFACLRWLEAEGYIELFYNERGEQMIRIAEGAENAKL